MTISEYVMNEVSKGDILIRNDDPKIKNLMGWYSNVGNKVSVLDRFKCIRPPSFLDNYGSNNSGDNNLIVVENLRTGDLTQCFWWRFKHEVSSYDPTQMGDKDDDI